MAQLQPRTDGVQPTNTPLPYELIVRSTTAVPRDARRGNETSPASAQ